MHTGIYRHICVCARAHTQTHTVVALATTCSYLVSLPRLAGTPQRTTTRCIWIPSTKSGLGVRGRPLYLWPNRRRNGKEKVAAPHTPEASASLIFGDCP